MVISRNFLNATCDNCGCMLDEDNWFDEPCYIDSVMDSCNWITVNGKHYCPDCYSYDDEDNLVIGKDRKI